LHLEVAVENSTQLNFAAGKKDYTTNECSQMMKTYVRIVIVES